MKSKNVKIIVSVITLLLSVLSACIGFALLTDAVESSCLRYLCGFCFIGTPVMVISLINVSFDKGEK